MKCLDNNAKLTPEERTSLRNYIARTSNAIRSVAESGSDTSLPELASPHTFAEISAPPPEDRNPHAIFANSFARKGHLMLLVSISGAGKSTGAIQQSFAWAKGEAGVFGITPIRPLRIAYIGCEDDNEELYELRKNMRIGYLAQGWTNDDINHAENSIVDESDSFVGLRGTRFARQLANLLKTRRYDLVILNPLLAYFGINLSKNEDLSKFLREELDPVLKDQENGCLLVGIHHTTKPPEYKSRNDGWGTDAMAAYVGAGGAELVNYARAVLVLVPHESRQKEGVYKLVGAKRGQRLGWKSTDGSCTKTRIVAHSTNCIFWRQPTASELATAESSINPDEAKKDASILAKLPMKQPVLKSNVRDFAKGWKDKTTGKWHEGIFDNARGERAVAYLFLHLKEFNLVEQQIGKCNATLIGHISQIESAKFAYLNNEYIKPCPENFPDIHP